MPRLIQPASLERACLQSIADRFTYWWFELRQSANQSDFVSPFQYLRDEMIQVLIDLLCPVRKNSPFQRRFIKVLFHPNLRALNLKPFTQMNNPCIRLLGIRCPKLTHLSLEGLTAIQPAVLCKLARSLPQLVSLQLKKTQTDGTVLKAISKHCHKLLDLNVEECVQLESSDFLHLCKQPGPQLRKLSLSELELEVTDALSRGLPRPVHIIKTLLECHPNLQYLGDCELISQAIQQIYYEKYHSKKDSPKPWIQNLCCLTIFDPRDACFQAVPGIVYPTLTLQCCPNLTSLSLMIFHGSVNSFSAISKLKHLKDLTLYRGFYDFDADIIPILEKIGKNLTSLFITSLYEIDVISIGELCPNLHSLHFEDLSIDNNSRYNLPADNQLFRQLRVLSLENSGLEDYPITTGLLSLILENASEITKIIFYNVENLTDQIIAKANEKHSFCSLTHARFVFCHSITKKTGMILLSHENSLEDLYFNCKQIKKEENDFLKTFAKHNQFDVMVNK